MTFIHSNCKEVTPIKSTATMDAYALFAVLEQNANHKSTSTLRCDPAVGLSHRAAPGAALRDDGSNEGSMHLAIVESLTIGTSSLSSHDSSVDARYFGPNLRVSTTTGTLQRRISTR
jgi:hypothetical protein